MRRHVDNPTPVIGASRSSGTLKVELGISHSPPPPSYKTSLHFQFDIEEHKEQNALPSSHHVKQPPLPGQLPGRLPRPIHLQGLRPASRHIHHLLLPNLPERPHHRNKSRHLRPALIFRLHIPTLPPHPHPSIAILRFRTALRPSPRPIPGPNPPLPPRPSLPANIPDPHHPQRSPAPRKRLLQRLGRLPRRHRAGEVVYRGPDAGRRRTLLSPRHGHQGWGAAWREWAGGEY